MSIRIQQINQTDCNLSINYTNVPGTPILPFIITLDTTLSILDPAPGQNQRFCYRVIGVGQDNNTFADLSHIVFGICDEIPASQIVNITVVIDGEPQNVVFGPDGNVELFPPNNPDPPTGCPGLKYDFGLDKVDGEMLVCFELTTPYPIGPNPVCLFGGGVTRNGLSVCGPVCDAFNQCESTAYQRATVCAPVNVSPFAMTGTPITRCCGDPIITPGTTICNGTPSGSCTFTITQTICVEVPVNFGANTVVGVPFVQCGEATEENICANCDMMNSQDD
jgi:hypothetical protein